MKLHFLVFLLLSEDEGQATTILADLYVESFGNIEEANMVRIILFLYDTEIVYIDSKSTQDFKTHFSLRLTILPANININLKLALAVFL